MWELVWPVMLVEGKEKLCDGWGSSPLPPFDPKTGGVFSREHTSGITRVAFSSKRMDAVKVLGGFF